MGKKTVRYLLPLIHFILSFFYERIIITFNNTSGIRLAIPRSDAFSDTAEHVMAYGISKLFAAVFIFLLWKLIFFVFSNLNKLSVKVSLTIFVILVVIFGVFLLPDVKLRSADNYITYLYAINLWPEYWHSAYLSIIYTALLMIFPNPVIISIMQWVGLSFAIGYAFERVESSPVLKGKLKWVVLAVFLLPNSYILVVDAYRTEIYAIICMFFVTVLVMDAVDGVKRNTLQMILLAVLAGFLAVFRSEGIILGVGGYMAMLIYGYKLNVKKVIAFSAAAVVAFILFAVPQKLGDRKYYGKDYTIINSFPSLVNILNSESHNITYDGAEEALGDINRVVPLDVIRFYGMNGYHRFNLTEGRADINQSYASDLRASAYVSGFYSLVFHNPGIYLKTQGVMWLQSLCFDIYPYVEPAVGLPHSTEIVDFSFDTWYTGEAKYTEDLGFEAWAENPFRKAVAGLLDEFFTAVHNVSFKVLFIATITLIVLTILSVVIMGRECVLFFEKKRENTAIGVFMLILLIQYAAIVLVMPAGAQVYFHATYIGMFVTAIIYLNKLLCDKKAEK